MEIKVLIDENNKKTSVEFDESKYDKGTVGAFLIAALFIYIENLPAVERSALKLACCQTMMKGGRM